MLRFVAVPATVCYLMTMTLISSATSNEYLTGQELIYEIDAVVLHKLYSTLIPQNGTLRQYVRKPSALRNIHVWDDVINGCLHFRYYVYTKSNN
jgi:hypothetical protein